MTVTRAVEQALKRHSELAAKTAGRKSGKKRPAHLLLGEEAEDLAVSYLVGKNFKIIGRNVRCGGGELDIVAEDGDEIVFVEVRARSVGIIMPARTTVGSDKLRKLTRAASAWAEERRCERFMRIDLVAISYGPSEKPVIEHIRSITEVMT
jgi:putative endonuclease